MTDEEPERSIAWIAITEREPVLARDGEKLGEVEEVLGTGETGIFHGIVVKPGILRDPISVPATAVRSITSRKVTLTVGKPEFEALPPHVEEESFRLGIRGLFRHHPGWVSDSKGDS
ncbi:MAG TPA: PRC-barrel domain-containing protein [Chloroflexota bacterium]|jgi:uncharacterized protein YrrD|nr:PRC-barrel domain-containing protein [Chloroflexota bacterium]